MNREALLEIGSEELPASFIAIGMRQLKALAEDSLRASGLSFSAVDVYGTPRRLAVAIHGLPPSSPDQKKVVTGPPEAIAKDAQGQWTAAALGFARKQGLKPSELAIENGKVSATLHIKGVSTRHLLAELFPQWITKLEFPKAMTWEETHFRYPRPIRWIAAMYGADLVSCGVAGVRSARWSLGIGPWAPKRISLAQAGKYAIVLKNQCVLVEPSARQEAIRRYAEQAVKRSHGKVIMAPALLEQVANLVEHPVAILGNFDPSYLDLPREVLITCLEHHQKYFPVEQASGGKLLPHFVGIRNGMSVNQDIVREGYERVLAARLADARFFFNQDRKSPLSAKVDALKGVMFQQKLGSVYDKKERVKRLIAFLATILRLGDQERDFSFRAADLAKADLVTGIVGEFPELQGTMAGIYALADGEDPLVAKACEQHYWPITLTGPLPATSIAAVVALADKLDTLAGDFSVGLIPSGSADPYGLRRAAVGVLRILEKFNWSAPLSVMVQEAVALQPTLDSSEASVTQRKLVEFMTQRWSAWVLERGLCDAQEAQAVPLISIPESLQIVEAIRLFRTDPIFGDFLILIKRANQLLKKSNLALPSPGYASGSAFFPITGFDAGLLSEEAEIRLWSAAQGVRETVEKKILAGDYLGAMKDIVQLKEPIDHFFEKVMVMVEDEKLRTNRLNLLGSIVIIALAIADFSKLQNA